MKKLWTAGLAALMACAFFAGCGSESEPKAAASDAVKETMRPFSVRQIVAADNGMGRTIMWQLTTEKEAVLEYRAKDSSAIESVKAERAAYKGNQGVADSFIYTARLTNL